MKTYSCSGTLGDTLIALTKLYKMPREPILCNHYTLHSNLHPMIKEIYSLMPNVEVKFVNERDVENERIYTEFLGHVMPYEPFLEFDLPEVDVPDEYTCIVPVSGRQHDRVIQPPFIFEECKDDKHLIFLGGQEIKTAQGSELDGFDFEVDNRTGETSLLESFAIIVQADKLIVPQGLMCFFGLSQKVNTIVGLMSIQDIDGFYNRFPDEWKPYADIKDLRNE